MWRITRLTRNRTAEPVLRDQILRREREQGNINFISSADHEQVGNRLIHILLYEVRDGCTYMKYIDAYIVLSISSTNHFVSSTYASMTLANFQFPESHKISFCWDADVRPESEIRPISDFKNFGFPAP